MATGTLMPRHTTGNKPVEAKVPRAPNAQLKSVFTREPDFINTPPPEEKPPDMPQIDITLSEIDNLLKDLNPGNNPDLTDSAQECWNSWMTKLRILDPHPWRSDASPQIGDWRTGLSCIEMTRGIRSKLPTDKLKLCSPQAYGTCDLQLYGAICPQPRPSL